MDKLAKYNNGVKYLLVAVDELSRFLEVELMKTKSAADSTRAFKRMIKSFPEKSGQTRDQSLNGNSSSFAISKTLTFTAHSEKKSALAEQNIRSLKNII